MKSVSCCFKPILFILHLCFFDIHQISIPFYCMEKSNLDILINISYCVPLGEKNTIWVWNVKGE